MSKSKKSRKGKHPYTTIAPPAPKQQTQNSSESPDKSANKRKIRIELWAAIIGFATLIVTLWIFFSQSKGQKADQYKVAITNLIQSIKEDTLYVKILLLRAPKCTKTQKWVKGPLDVYETVTLAMNFYEFPDFFSKAEYRQTLISPGYAEIMLDSGNSRIVDKMRINQQIYTLLEYNNYDQDLPECDSLGLAPIYMMTPELCGEDLRRHTQSPYLPEPIMDDIRRLASVGYKPISIGKAIEKVGDLKTTIPTIVLVSKKRDIFYQPLDRFDLIYEPYFKYTEEEYSWGQLFDHTAQLHQNIDDYNDYLGLPRFYTWDRNP